MSNEVMKEALVVDATLAEIGMAVSEVLLKHIPEKTTPDPLKVTEVIQGIMAQAKRVDRSPADIALKVIQQSLDAEPDPTVRVMRAGGLLKLMESLKPTPELANDAADTFSAAHHDETDIALVKAFKEVINTSGGLGPAPGTLWDWAEATFGVAVGNAVGFASNINRLLEGEGMEERKAKLIRKLTEAAFAYAPEKVKAMIEPAMEQLGSSQAILFLWALFNEGVKQGMIMGWRSHELALLASVEAPPAEE